MCSIHPQSDLKQEFALQQSVYLELAFSLWQGMIILTMGAILSKAAS